MIDTVTITFPDGGQFTTIAVAILQGDHSQAITGWVDDIRPTHNAAGELVMRGGFRHCASELRVIPTACGTVKIEFEASRMLYADNSRLLKSNDELRTSLTRAIDIAAGVVAPHPDGAYFSRVDCTCFVATPPTTLLPLFEKRKHPRIRKLPAHFPNESLTWKGTGHRLCFYDKAAQRKLGTDLRTRVELQVRGAKMAEYFDLKTEGRLWLGDLTLESAYRVLRTFLLQFPSTAVAGRYSHDAGIAWMMAKGVSAPDGRHILDWRTDGLEEFREKRVRRQIEKLSLKLSGFDWADFLPAAPTPAQLISLTDWSPPSGPNNTFDPAPGMMHAA